MRRLTWTLVKGKDYYLESFVSKTHLKILRYCLEVKGLWADKLYGVAILHNQVDILDYLLTFKPTDKKLSYMPPPPSIRRTQKDNRSARQA